MSVKIRKNTVLYNLASHKAHEVRLPPNQNIQGAASACGHVSIWEAHVAYIEGVTLTSFQPDNTCQRCLTIGG